MSKPRFKTRKVIIIIGSELYCPLLCNLINTSVLLQASLLTSSVWFSLANSWKMDAHCRIITFRKVCALYFQVVLLNSAVSRRIMTDITTRIRVYRTSYLNFVLVLNLILVDGDLPDPIWRCSAWCWDPHTLLRFDECLQRNGAMLCVFLVLKMKLIGNST